MVPLAENPEWLKFFSFKPDFGVHKMMFCFFLIGKFFEKVYAVHSFIWLVCLFIYLFVFMQQAVPFSCRWWAVMEERMMTLPFLPMSSSMAVAVARITVSNGEGVEVTPAQSVRHYISIFNS